MTGIKLLSTLMFDIQIYFRYKMLSAYGITFQGNNAKFLHDF